jgi:ankyrin repeat protein
MGKTPLHLLGESRPGPAWPIQIAEILLDKGASLDPKSIDRFGWTPSDIASILDLLSGL